MVILGQSAVHMSSYEQHQKPTHSRPLSFASTQLEMHTVVGTGVRREPSVVQQQVPDGDGLLAVLSKVRSQQCRITDLHVCIARNKRQMDVVVVF